MGRFELSTPITVTNDQNFFIYTSQKWQSIKKTLFLTQLK